MRKKEDSVKEILTISEAAKLLGVLPLTLRNWEKKGLLRPFRTLGGHRRFRKTDLEQIINSVKKE
ncbi:MAG: MerR family DNA-binding transcriptional regulator [Candidatus Omnitrophica bacterium]|nr:MerR family DNA-binding transcriptional regulator [Candidatus Omnitrophota bacterium]